MDSLVPASAFLTAKASKTFPIDADGDEGFDHGYQKVNLPRKNVSRPSRETLPDEVPENSSEQFASLAASAPKASKSSSKETDGDEDIDPNSVYQKVKLPRKNLSRPSRETLPDEVPENNSVQFASLAAPKASNSSSKETDGDEDFDPNSVYQKVKLPRKNVSQPSRETSPDEVPENNSVQFASMAASAPKASKSSSKETDGDEDIDPDAGYQKVKLPRSNRNQQSRLTPAPADKPNVVPANRTVPLSSIAAPAAPILPSSTPAVEALDAPASSHVDAANAAVEASAPAISFSQEAPATGDQGGGAGQVELVTPSSRRFKKRMSQSPAGVEHLTPTSKKRKLANRSYWENMTGSVSRIAEINRFLEDNLGVDAISPLEDDAAWFQKRRMSLTPAVRRPSLGAAVRPGVTPGHAGRGGWSVQRCALMQEAGQAGKGSRQAGSKAGEARSKQAGLEEAVQVGKASSKQAGEASAKPAGEAEEAGEGGLKVMAKDTVEQVISEGATAEQVQTSGEAGKQGGDLGMGVEGPVELTKEFLESRMNVIFAQETCNADQKPVRIARQVKACLKRCYLASMLDIRAFEASTSEGSEEEEEENAGKSDGGVSGKRVEPAAGEQEAGGGRNESLASVRFRLQGLREIKEDLLKQLQEIEALEKLEEAEEEDMEQSNEEGSDEEESLGGEEEASNSQVAEAIEEILPVVEEKAYPGAAAAAVGGTGDSRGSTAAVRGVGGLAGVPLAVLTPRTAARGLANLGHPDMPTDLE
ncbi:unnamed protein product [Closterium sp. NIES-53]